MTGEVDSSASTMVGEALEVQMEVKTISVHLLTADMCAFVELLMG